MKIFTKFLFFALLAFGESSVSIKEQFDVLIQNILEIINSTGIFAKKNFLGAYGNGNAYSHNLQIDHIITLVAKGTCRLTGIDSNYIIEVLNGQNPPPFQSQLSCIKDGLIEMRNAVINEKNTTKYFKKNFVKQKTNTKTCEDFTADIMPHFIKLNEIYIPEILRFRGNKIKIKFQINQKIKIQFQISFQFLKA
ncbi:hypothetical protein ACKWTF_004650 [Chironomus riparius]